MPILQHPVRFLCSQRQQEDNGPNQNAKKESRSTGREIERRDGLGKHLDRKNFHLIQLVHEYMKKLH